MMSKYEINCATNMFIHINHPRKFWLQFWIHACVCVYMMKTKRSQILTELCSLLWCSAGFPLGFDSVSPLPQVTVVPSPGHTGQDVSVQVTETSVGTVLVAGDLFECCSDEDSWRDLSMNTAVQEVNRQEALRTADVIIPGHGLPFRVLRNWLANLEDP